MDADIAGLWLLLESAATTNAILHMTRGRISLVVSLIVISFSSEPTAVTDIIV